MKAIPNGLFKRLAKLTSISNNMMDNNINEMYPDHMKALKIAGLTPKKFPTFREIYNKLKKTNYKKKRRRKTRRNQELHIFVLEFVKLG